MNGGTWFAHETSPCQLTSASVSSDGSVRGKLMLYLSDIQNAGGG